MSNELYKAYSFRFEVGDQVTLVDGPAFWKAREEMNELFCTKQEDRVYYPDFTLDQEWCEQLTGLIGRISMRHHWHSGVPVYFVDWEKDGMRAQVRVCEPLLAAWIRSADDLEVLRKGLLAAWEEQQGEE